MSMPRILIVDSYYPKVIERLEVHPSESYESNLRRILDFSFGTFDAYSRNLKVLGWDAVDIIYNHSGLQQLWAREHSIFPTDNPWAVLEAQAAYFEPNIVFMQDLSIDPPAWPHRLLAGQCSCPWPGDERVRQYDVLFTSFPHYVERFESLGVKAVYSPLAFDAIILEHAKCVDLDKIYDCVFVGGVGNPSHWQHGMEMLNKVAAQIPTFKWWGYGAETLPDGPLKQKYQGEAWGLDMYRILSQSKICLNRHGEVAGGYSNNLRLFEATGCGALLLTEDSPNLSEFFTKDECLRYYSPEDAVTKIRFLLDHPGARSSWAHNGQARTLRDHTYAQRMKIVSETLESMLCPV